MATGSEVAIALDAQKLWQRQGGRRRRGVDAVLGTFRPPAEEYRAAILGKGPCVSPSRL